MFVVAHLQALFQAGLDKLIQIPVQHGLSVTGFDARTQILDATLIKHIGANLTAPADIGFPLFNDRRCSPAFLHLQFIEFCLELLHRARFVLVL